MRDACGTVGRIVITTTGGSAQNRRLCAEWPGDGALAGGAAAEVWVLEGGRQVGGLVGQADVGARRDDLVDLVVNVVAERDVDSGDQVVQLLHRARADDRAGHAGMGDRERHREVRHRQARLLGDGNDLLDGIEPGLGAEAGEQCGAVQVGLQVLADAAGEHSLGERAPHHHVHPVTLGDGQHLGLDAAVEDRVGRLLGAEPLQAAPLGHPPGLAPHRQAHLGREDDIIAAPFQRLADDLLGLAARVSVSGVDEVDPPRPAPCG
jgi:hypothetical protein